MDLFCFNTMSIKKNYYSILILKLSNLQLNKPKLGIKYGTQVTSNLLSNMIIST